jgi:hypothetical protein
MFGIVERGRLAAGSGSIVSGLTEDVMRQRRVFLDAGPGIEQTTNLERKAATEITEGTEKQR